MTEPDDAAFDTLPDDRARRAEDRPREPSPNPTQQRMDEEQGGDAPVDAPWTEEE